MLLLNMTSSQVKKRRVVLPHTSSGPVPEAATTILSLLDLFDWYIKVKRYIAPYFPLIQSSGMGKTKLMIELRKYVNQNLAPDMFCKTVLCDASVVLTSCGLLTVHNS